MARGNRKRINGVSGHPMREAGPLAVAFIAGTAGCIAFKFFPVSPLVGALFAAAVLVAYALVAYNTTALRLDAETIGDNCYYLGFLFTLTSLAVTLYFVIQAPSQNRADMIPEIIAGFGVALSSTIFGVFLRVFMMQFKVDMDSRERLERHALNEASRRFRTELGMSLDQVKKFSVESLQQGVEREKRMRDAFDTLLSDMQQELLKSAEQFGPALRESVRMQTEASLGLVTKAVNEASATAAEGIRKAVTEMAGTASNLAAQNADAAEQIRKNVSLIVDATEKLSTDVEGTLTILSRVQGTATTMTETFEREVAETSSRMTQAMESARKNLEDGTQGFSQATIRAGNVIDRSIDSISQSFDATAAKVGEAGERLAHRLDTMAPGAGVVVPGPGRPAGMDGFGGGGSEQPAPQAEPETRSWFRGRKN